MRTIFLTCLFAAAMFLQGGFYPVVFLMIGLMGAVFFLFSKRKIEMDFWLIGLLMIAAITLLTSAYRGVSYSSISRALLPMAVFSIYCVLKGLTGEEKKRLLRNLTILGIVSGCLAIFMFFGIFRFPGGMNQGRLQFTFQYANAAGIWFVAAYTLARDSEDKRIQKLCLIPAAALFMTRSMGALLIFCVFQVLWLIRRYKKTGGFSWKLWVGVFGVALVAAAVALSRTHAYYTGMERVIQSLDGMRAVAAHPLAGLGAGNWKYLYPFYQSAEYQAAVVHNSYVQMGVDAGLLPMVLLLLMLCVTAWRWIKEQGQVRELLLLLLLHGLMDYDFSFFCIDLLIVILMVCQEDGKKEGKFHFWKRSFSSRIPYRLCAAGLILILGTGYYSAWKVNQLSRLAASGQYSMAVTCFQKDKKQMQKGYEEQELYIEALYQNGDYETLLEEADTFLSTPQNRFYKLAAKKQIGKLTEKEIEETVAQIPYQKEWMERIRNLKY